MAERKLTRLRLSAGIVALASSSLACGGDDATAPAAPVQGSDAAPPTTSGATTPGGTSEAGARPPSSPLPSGWQKAFNRNSVAINCKQTLAEMTAAGATALKIGSSTIVVGFEPELTARFWSLGPDTERGA